jgi:trehalose 6-phosphate phosphatase
MPGLLAPLRGRPERAAVLCDFDGTLSPIVTDPADARPVPGVVETLAALAQRYAVVAVVSGRPVTFLVDRLGTGGGSVILSGLYGLESARRDATGRWSITRATEALPWEPVITGVADEAAAAAPAGVLVEPKGLSLTIHWRMAPAHAGWATTYAARAAARTGLAVHEAKASVELRIPIERDKGTVVEELAAGLEAVVFLGDDLGDLPAVAAVRRLPAHGLVVVVGTAETPRSLVEAADIVVDGPEGALAVLQDLLP